MSEICNKPIYGLLIESEVIEKGIDEFGVRELPTDNYHRLWVGHEHYTRHFIDKNLKDGYGTYKYLPTGKDVYYFDDSDPKAILSYDKDTLIQLAPMALDIMIKARENQIKYLKSIKDSNNYEISKE